MAEIDTDTLDNNASPERMELLGHIQQNLVSWSSGDPRRVCQH